MLIDITLEITPKMAADAQGNEKKALAGHLGTHFDIMDKVFPLTYIKRNGIAFDVSHVTGRDISLSDIELDKVSRDMFVAFFTGHIERTGYGGKAYLSGHPQLSHELLGALLDKEISLIGVDFAGIRRRKEHVPADQACADRSVFVIENLCGLKAVVDVGGKFLAYTLPMRCAGMTGLPCRVIAEI